MNNFAIALYIVVRIGDKSNTRLRVCLQHLMHTLVFVMTSRLWCQIIKTTVISKLTKTFFGVLFYMQSLLNGVH